MKLVPDKRVSKFLTLCMLGNIPCFLVVCSFFSELFFFKFKIPCLDPDQAQLNIEWNGLKWYGLDLAPRL